MGRKWNGKHSNGKRDSENTGGTLGRSRRILRGTEELEKDFVVWCGVFDNLLCGVRLRVGRLQANFGDKWWMRCVTILRRNTEQATKAQWLALFFQSQLWQGIGRGGVRDAYQCGGTGVPHCRMTKTTKRGLQRGAIGERFSPGQQGFLQLPLETATTNAAKGLCQWMHGA